MPGLPFSTDKFWGSEGGGGKKVFILKSSSLSEVATAGWREEQSSPRASDAKPVDGYERMTE